MIRCIKIRRYEKNTLKGFVDLELIRTGIIIRDCTWHRHENGREWVSFPARPYEDKNGNTAWQPLVEFAEGASEARKQFQQQALKAIHTAIAEQQAIHAAVAEHDEAIS